MVAAETSPSFIPVAGDLINGKYQIEQLLGRGGMGAVFSAHNRLTGRRVALKWILPDRATAASHQRLLREARTTCSVTHPNVVQVYDVCEHRGGLFLVMEYLAGEPLSAFLQERGALDPVELIQLLMPVMRGVQAAHDAGIVHRDLKPDNILLCPVDAGELLPKVLDFGVSKSFELERRMETSLTHSGALVGTPHFMALEQVDGSGDIDLRTDVYAFGVILYLGLTGTYPFDGDSLGELILKIGTRTPPSIRTHRPYLPVSLSRVVARAMARARNDRYSSVRELAEALEPFADGVRFARASADTSRSHSVVSPEHPVAAQRPWSRTRPHRRSVGMALVALAAMGLGAWWALREPALSAPGETTPSAPLQPIPTAEDPPTTPLPSRADVPTPPLPGHLTPPPDLLGPRERDATVSPSPPPTEVAEEDPAAGRVARDEGRRPPRGGKRDRSPPIRNAKQARRAEPERDGTRDRPRPHRNAEQAQKATDGPPSAKASDERIQGQRTSGLSEDDF